MPNVFSMNPTNKVNGEIRPFVNPELEIITYEFNIFDRWGNSICTSTDIEEGWEGDYLGKIAESDVYVWMYKIETMHCGQRVVYKDQGDVTILK